MIMPVEATLLSAEPPAPEDLLAALRSRVPDGVVQVLPGAAAQLVDADGRVLATVIAPRSVAVPTEVRRLLGVDDDSRTWWSEIVADQPGEVLDAVLGALAARVDGRVVRADSGG